MRKFFLSAIPDSSLRLLSQSQFLTPALPPLPTSPDHRNLTLGWVHRHDDLTVEPSYNLGTESLSAAVTYRVDDENSLKAHFDMNTNNGSLTWTNSGALGGGGNLRVTATAAMDGGAVKQVPSLRIEKDWDIDA